MSSIPESCTAIAVGEVESTDNSQNLDALRDLINSGCAEIKSTTLTLVKRAIEIGTHLHEVKSLLPHGRFGPWCDENLRVGSTQRSAYMKLAANREKTEALLASNPNHSMRRLVQALGSETSSDTEASDDGEFSAPELSAPKPAATSSADGTSGSTIDEPSDPNTKADASAGEGEEVIDLDAIVDDPRWKEHYNALGRLATFLSEQNDGGWKEQVALFGTRMLREVRAIRSSLRLNSPAGLCPECEGEGCNHCRGTGVASEFQLKQRNA